MPVNVPLRQIPDAMVPGMQGFVSHLLENQDNPRTVDPGSVTVPDGTEAFTGLILRAYREFEANSNKQAALDVYRQAVTAADADAASQTIFEP